MTHTNQAALPTATGPKRIYISWAATTSGYEVMGPLNVREDFEEGVLTHNTATVLVSGRTNVQSCNNTQFAPTLTILTTDNTNYTDLVSRIGGANYLTIDGTSHSGMYIVGRLSKRRVGGWPTQYYAITVSFVQVVT